MQPSSLLMQGVCAALRYYMNSIIDLRDIQTCEYYLEVIGEEDWSVSRLCVDNAFTRFISIAVNHYPHRLSNAMMSAAVDDVKDLLQTFLSDFIPDYIFSPTNHYF